MEAKQECGWQGISGSILKVIAVVTMLTDHIAAVVLVRVILASGGSRDLYEVYNIMRQIGRTAFPIYCFLLVEGLEHTRSRWKYAARMGGFALLSEIPFDLAFSGKVLEFRYQNVFFTLAIGLLSMIVIDTAGRRVFCPENRTADALTRGALIISASLGGMALAAFLQTDYSWMGVACILLLYFLRGRQGWQLAMGYAAFVLLLGEIAALPAFLLLALYRGKKGFSCKYFFYGFYPVHLLLLYLACVLMGIAAYPAV